MSGLIVKTLVGTTIFHISVPGSLAPDSFPANVDLGSNSDGSSGWVPAIQMEDLC